jgi:hypothetical protein
MLGIGFCPAEFHEVERGIHFLQVCGRIKVVDNLHPPNLITGIALEVRRCRFGKKKLTCRCTRGKEKEFFLIPKIPAL